MAVGERRRHCTHKCNLGGPWSFSQLKRPKTKIFSPKHPKIAQPRGVDFSHLDNVPIATTEHVQIILELQNHDVKLTLLGHENALEDLNVAIKSVSGTLKSNQ